MEIKSLKNKTFVYTYKPYNDKFQMTEVQEELQYDSLYEDLEEFNAISSLSDNGLLHLDTVYSY